jgi:hypothetical protein
MVEWFGERKWSSLQPPHIVVMTTTLEEILVGIFRFPSIPPPPTLPPSVCWEYLHSEATAYSSDHMNCTTLKEHFLQSKRKQKGRCSSVRGTKSWTTSTSKLKRKILNWSYGKTGCEDRNWTQLSHDRVEWWCFGSVTFNPRVALLECNHVPRLQNTGSAKHQTIIIWYRRQEF